MDFTRPWFDGLMRIMASPGMAAAWLSLGRGWMR